PDWPNVVEIRMQPSSVRKPQNLPYWEDFRKPIKFEGVNLAYDAGDYTTAINLLTSLLNNTAEFEGYSRELFLLARAMCFQQLREFEYVVSNTTEVLKRTSVPPSPEIHGIYFISRCLALWLRSSAHESLDNWEKVKKDLEELKLLVRNNTVHSESMIFTVFPYVPPLFIISAKNTITINSNSVSDRLCRATELVNKEISRRNNALHAFRLIDDDASAFSESGKRFHYRLLLRRPLHPNIHIGMWYTMDLMLVSEMGLFKREDMQDP
ncbi:7280_t:CDS:2, partial [Acaulospora colombiana]